MGHQGWFLAVGCGRGRRVEFCIRSAAKSWQAYLPRGTPSSLQMGWVESPSFFCAASETARDVAHDYCETKIDTLPPHKSLNHVTGNQAYDELPERDNSGNNFRYLLEVYVNNFVSLVIPTSREQLCHIPRTTLPHQYGHHGRNTQCLPSQ